MKYLHILLFLCVAFSCAETKKAITLDDCDVVATKTNDHLIVCKQSEIRQTITLSFSELFKEWGLVKLENTSKDMMVGPDQRMFISDNYILIWGEKNKDMLLFDKHGKFQRRIGQPGNGPGDIMGQLYHTQIDETNDVVYFSDFNRKRISMYQLSTGKHIGEYPFDVQGLGKFILDINTQLLIVTASGRYSDFIICVQKLDGKKIASIPNNRGSDVGWRDEFLWKNGDDMLNYNFDAPIKIDSLYHYDMSNNKLTPCFTIDFDEDLPNHRYYATNQYYIGIINRLWMGPGYHVYPQKWILVDKHSLKGAYTRVVLDRYGDLDVTEASPCSMFGDYYAVILMPDKVIELCEKTLLENTDLSAESKERLQTLLDGIEEDDNCFVLYGKIN